MRKITRANLIYIIFLALKINLLSCSEQERKAAGQLLLQQLQTSIDNYYKQIHEIEKQSYGISPVLTEFELQKKNLDTIKNLLGISPLEAELASSIKQLDSLVPTIYARAFVKDTSLYQQLNVILKTLYNDPEIKKKIERINSLKKELYEIIENDAKIVAQEGKIIYNLIGKENQQAIDQITTHIQQIQAKIASITNSTQAINKLAPVKEKIQKLEREIALKIQGLSVDNQQKIRKNKELIDLLSMMLEILRDPKKAAQASAKDISLTD